MVMRGKGSRVREGSCECTSRLTNQTALSEAWSHVKRAGSERRRPLILSKRSLQHSTIDRSLECLVITVKCIMLTLIW
jgi:hypothetical protein